MQFTNLDKHVQREAQRRRTFAIISHPDAGKTTLTEKLLLYGGQIEVAGAVRGRKTQRSATSDWMELEKQRGISVSSTVLTFEYNGFCINLLDTPGHHDFSEDTYRTLMAADCAVMVVDLAKGIEPQTRKLFEVCALRKIPVLTFVNKVDRPGKDPLTLLSEIESLLKIEPVPMNWPLDAGLGFRGLVDLRDLSADVFEQSSGDIRASYNTHDLSQLHEAGFEVQTVQQVQEEVALLASAGSTFERDRFLKGEITPLFFGSALRNYGLEHFLEGFLEFSPPPVDRLSHLGPVPAHRSEFSGFIFKIQANLDPRHRDRIAFLRVCSGRFQREMEVVHARTGTKLRLKRAQLVFGRERETVEEAFPGDIVGLANPGTFHLGDTLCEREVVHFEPLPQFPPEHFAVLRCADTGRRKQFERGLEQLIEEGAIQIFSDPHKSQRESILAAVGELQFDVVRYRLESEYMTKTSIEWLPFKFARWVVPGETENTDRPALQIPYTGRLVKDGFGGTAVLLNTQWDCAHFVRNNPQYHVSNVRTMHVDYLQRHESASANEISA